MGICSFEEKKKFFLSFQQRTKTQRKKKFEKINFSVNNTLPLFR